MRRTAVLLFLIVTIVALILVSGAPSSQVIQGPEVENFLRKARFVGKEPLGSGVTGSLKVALELDGKKQFGVLKTVDQKRPGAQLNSAGKMEVDFQDSWRTEVAAYELDKLLELKMVPATVQRMSPYESKPGSLQLFVEASMSEGKRRQKAIIPPDPGKWSDQLSTMAVFDALIYNVDRNPDNLLITDTFEVRLIDHSRSFRPNAELQHPDDLMRFSRSLLARIDRLNKDAVGKRLGDYLTLAQIDGLMKRRQLILDRASALSKKLGEPVVFYP